MKDQTKTEKKQPQPRHILVEVAGITKEEYVEAAHQTSRQFFVMLIFVMAIFCGIIMLATKNFGLKAFVGPVVIYVIAFVGYELYLRHSYKPELSDIGMKLDLCAASWTIEVGESKAEVEWRGTVKLKETKHCLFLYNDDTHSNLLPLRAISAEEKNTILNWYQKSRAEAKSFIAARDRAERMAEREKMKERRKNNRFWGNGPVWGPFKRK